MALLERQLAEVWKALRSQNTQRANALTEVRLRNLRGIRNLSVPFQYPVSVLAGPNGCGKSTVLFACAYRVPDSAGLCSEQPVPQLYRRRSRIERYGGNNRA